MLMIEGVHGIDGIVSRGTNNVDCQSADKVNLEIAQRNASFGQHREGAYVSPVAKPEL